ncbi:MAG: ABC transporter ATP-binding protein [Chloroflexota bacterium]
MTEFAIETQGLTRQYGAVVAVDKLSLQVPRGSMYGFLGPNGAGKTTTIRTLLGLIRPNAGQVMLFGQPFQRKLLGKVGALVETPSLYPNLTGRENLEVTRRLLDAKSAQIERALKIVNLQDVGGKLVKNYSLGMKQRLGIALALLNEPELLMLDEPTNGLDPAGIHEIRELLRRLPTEFGITVFLSSHLLGEVEQIATHLGIINQGKLIYQGTMASLENMREDHVRLGAFEPEGALVLLQSAGYQVHMDDEKRLIVSAARREEAARINATLVKQSKDVYHLSLERRSLEDIFLQLTAEGAQS